MEHSESRRQFLSKLLWQMPQKVWHRSLPISDSKYDVNTKLQIPVTGIEITGRKPTPIQFFELKRHYDMLVRDHGEEHPRFGTSSYLYVDGVDSASSGLNIYRVDDSLLIATDSGGFYPTMWHADEVQHALKIDIPGKRPGHSSDLHTPNVVEEPGNISLYNYTNGRTNRLHSKRYIVGDAVCKIVPDGEQEFVITANDVVIGRIESKYSVADYEPDDSRNLPYKSYGHMTLSELRDFGLGCCIRELELEEHKLLTDVEWAQCLADFYTEVAPGLTVNQEANQVSVSFEPLNINRILSRTTFEGKVHYTLHEDNTSTPIEKFSSTSLFN